MFFHIFLIQYSKKNYFALIDRDWERSVLKLNLHFLQFVHRSEASSLNVLETTCGHVSNKIINVLKEDSFNKCLLQDVRGYEHWSDEIYGEEQHLPRKIIKNSKSYYIHRTYKWTILWNPAKVSEVKLGPIGFPDISLWRKPQVQ